MKGKGETMSRSGNQKRKILLIERMMLRSDAEHPVSMKEMLDILAEQGISAERKSIYDDMEELRAMGMDIVFKKSAPSGYYLQGIGEHQELLKLNAVPEDYVAQEDHAQECAAAEIAEEGDTEKVVTAGDISFEEDSAEEIPAMDTTEENVKKEREASDTEGVVFFKVQKGEYAALQLRCKKNLLKALRARYGENLTCKTEAEKRVLVEVNDIPGEQFYAWLLSMEGAVRLVKPKDEVKKLKKAIKKLTE